MDDTEEDMLENEVSDELDEPHFLQRTKVSS